MEAWVLLLITVTIIVCQAPFLIMAMLASQADSVRLDSAHHLFNMVLAVMAPFIVGILRCCKYLVLTHSLSSVKSCLLISDSI